MYEHTHMYGVYSTMLVLQVRHFVYIFRYTAVVYPIRMYLAKASHREGLRCSSAKFRDYYSCRKLPQSKIKS